MPTPGLHLENSVNPASAIMSLNLRRSYDEQLKHSRNKFNKSRSRVEILKQKKKTHCSRSQSSMSWISNGPIDSRDATLIFRTNILNTNDEILSNSSNISDTSTDLKKIDVDKMFPEIKSEKLSNSNLLLDDLDDSCNIFDSGEESIKTNRMLVGNNNNYEGIIEDKENSDNTKMPAYKLNIKFKFNNSETKLLRRIFTRHGLTETDSETNFHILWTGAHMKADLLRNLTPYQRVNHFPRSYELTRKDRLYKNIEKLQYIKGFKHFDIIPQSFVLPIEHRDLIAAHHRNRGPWIVKPTASSRGRGIYIVKSPDQIPAEESVLVSKYIFNPLCIDGHKCDIRLYVLVTSFDPLVVYVYEEGLVRLATVKYDPNFDTLWNSCMHLTNYSINKYHSNYIKSADADDEDVGHKWTLSALLRHLRNQNCDIEQLMSNIEDLIIKSMFACAHSINTACRMFVPCGNNCFELYGFDILVDDTLKPWLLEINLSPSLGVGSPLDTKVKASLITDLLTLIGIPAFSKEMRDKYDQKWSRFKNCNVGGGRRTNSAEPVANLKPKSSATSANETSVEGAKVLRNIKLQNSRRGGFVRIFPGPETWQKYQGYLDPHTGIPLTSTTNTAMAVIIQHNFNQMLNSELYNSELKIIQGNFFYQRMNQYCRPLESTITYQFGSKKNSNVRETYILKTQICTLIENGNELTTLQARQTFCLFLELLLKRLSEEPKPLHEKYILKFLNRAAGGLFKPSIYLKNPKSYRVESKDRSALICKLLNDYIESYRHETEAYLDSMETFGMIPIHLFNNFIAHATESDLEAILKLHTNVTHQMPFLYNRFRSPFIPTPPIPTGCHGFLKVLPLMVPGGNSDYIKLETKSSLNITESGSKINVDKKLPEVTAPTAHIPKSSHKSKKIKEGTLTRGLSCERNKNNSQTTSCQMENDKL